MIREERRRKQRLVTAFKVTVIALSVILILVLVAINAFRVKKVVVEGNELYDQSVIEQAVFNDQYSWNSLYVTLKYRFVDMGEVPFVDEMELSLDNPHTLHIKVYEKGILGYIYIPILGQNAYFDKDGFVVETSSEMIKNVPKVTGVRCDEVTLYEQLPLEDDSILRQLLNLTQTLKKYNLMPNEIAFDSAKNAEIYYGDIRIIVGNEENLSQKIIRLSSILPQLAGLKGTLHLENWTEETVDIVFDKEE